MLKIYRSTITGHTYQYEEGEQPPDCVPVEAEKAEPAKAEAKPERKAKTPRNKAAKPEDK